MYAKGSLDALILTVGGRLRKLKRWWKNSAISVYRMLPLKVWCSASSSIFWTSLLTDCKKPGLMCVTRFMSYLILRRLILQMPGLPFGRNDDTPSPRCYHQTLQYGYGFLFLFALILTRTSHHHQ